MNRPQGQRREKICHGTLQQQTTHLRIPIINCLNRRKIIAVTTQLKQLRKESLEKNQALNGDDLSSI